MQPIGRLAAIAGYAILFAMGLALAVSSVLEEARERRLDREGVRAEARVLSRELRRGPNVVAYEFEARAEARSGAARPVRRSIGVPEAAYREAGGGNIVVLYHPRDPEWNRPVERGYWWLGLVVGIGVGGLMMAYAATRVLALLVRRASR